MQAARWWRTERRGQKRPPRSNRSGFAMDPRLLRYCSRCSSSLAPLTWRTTLYSHRKVFIRKTRGAGSDYSDCSRTVAEHIPTTLRRARLFWNGCRGRRTRYYSAYGNLPRYKSATAACKCFREAPAFLSIEISSDNPAVGIIHGTLGALKTPVYGV